MALIGLRLVTGVMGGGKSYFMAETILNALKEGAQVHTNLDLNYDEVKRLGFEAQVVDLRNLDVKKDMRSVIRAGDEERPNVLALDEAALYFYVDDQNSQDERRDNKDILQFLTWARRFGLEIYFATQSSKNINVKLRRMSEYTVRCTNMTQVPYFGWLMSALFGEFRRAVYVTDEDREVFLCRSSARFSKHVGDFYHTHGFAGQAEKQNIVMNKVVTRRVPKRLDQRNGKLMLALFFLGGIATVWFLCSTIYGFMHPKSDVPKVAETPQATQPPGGPRVASFVARAPRFVVWTDKGESIYSGATVDGKTVKFIADYGQWLGITYHDKTTEKILLHRP